MEQKTFEQWEEQSGLLWKPASEGDPLLSQLMTQEEFFNHIKSERDNSPHPMHAHMVDFAYRKKWLADNGHAVTRANMVNHDLTVRQN